MIKSKFGLPSAAGSTENNPVFLTALFGTPTYVSAADCEGVVDGDEFIVWCYHHSATVLTHLRRTRTKRDCKLSVAFEWRAISEEEANALHAYEKLFDI